MKKLLNKIIARNETKKLEVTALEICTEKECPDGGYGWIICIAAAICQFIIMGIHNNFGILYTYFMKDLKADPADTSELLQLQFWAMTVGDFNIYSFSIKKHFIGIEYRGWKWRNFKNIIRIDPKLRFSEGFKYVGWNTIQLYVFHL